MISLFTPHFISSPHLLISQNCWTWEHLSSQQVFEPAKLPVTPWDKAHVFLAYVSVHKVYLIPSASPVATTESELRSMATKPWQSLWKQLSSLVLGLSSGALMSVCISQPAFLFPGPVPLSHLSCPTTTRIAQHQGRHLTPVVPTGVCKIIVGFPFWSFPAD